MAKQVLVQKRFDGGMSQDLQLGQKHSFAYSRHIDFRKKPSQMTVLPRTVREGQSVVNDLIQNSVMDSAGNLYFLGNQGYLYKRTAGVWGVVTKLDDGAFGLSYRSDVDKLFIYSTKTISEYSPLTNNPSIKANKYATSVSDAAGAVRTGGNASYTVPVAIAESASHRCDFTSDIEPLRKITVDVVDGGTGDWTLTLHDGANNTLGTSTVTNATITDGEQLEFTFTNQIRLYVKPNARTYHYHLTSTVGDGRVAASTGGDLNTANFSIYADRLIATKNGMHPTNTFLQYECIGNGNYLSVWEPLTDSPTNREYLRHRLVFPSGLEVCGTAVYREFEAIAMEQRTDAGTAQEGYIFFWDGISSTYSYFIKIPEGSPYSLHEHKDVLYYEAGGAKYAYAGGTPYKIRTFPGTDSEYSDASDTTITYPYMATVRRGIHLFGYPSTTTNEDLECGVYSYGQANKDFPESFGFSYTISTGTRASVAGALKIGHIKNYSDTLFMSWQDGSTYGIDRVDNTSDPFAESTWESLWFDNNMPFKQKTPLTHYVTFDTLPAGVSIVLKYRTSRSGAWTYSEPFTSANTPGNTAKQQVRGRFLEIQRGHDITITGSASPTITSSSLVIDDLRNEEVS